MVWDALSLDDKRLLSASELLGQELARRGKFATVEKVLLESARVLNERRWTEVQRTEDFIVVPVDFETARVKRHLHDLRVSPAARREGGVRFPGSLGSNRRRLSQAHRSALAREEP